MRRLEIIIDSMDINLSKLWEMVTDRKAMGQKELDMTGRLSNNNKKQLKQT